MQPKTIRTAGDKTLYVYQLGDDQKNITLILAQPLPDLTLLPGVHVAVEESILPDFKHWLANTLVADAARETGSSPARIGRLREALGVQAYTLKTANSPTTQWRRKRRQEDDDMI